LAARDRRLWQIQQQPHGRSDNDRGEEEEMGGRQECGSQNLWPGVGLRWAGGERVAGTLFEMEVRRWVRTGKRAWQQTRFKAVGA
jgi:hypothetical protein